MIITVSELDFPLGSETVSWNIRVSALPEVNVGFSAVESDNVIGSPPVCIHENVSESPSGSVLLEPSSVTRVLVETDWFGPALAIEVLFQLVT